MMSFDLVRMKSRTGIHAFEKGSSALSLPLEL
jgi:hypothetical protein